MKKALKFFGGAALFAASIPAFAAFVLNTNGSATQNFGSVNNGALTVSGGSGDSAIGSHSYSGGWVGADVSWTGAGTTAFTVEFLGENAGWNNEFEFAIGNSIFTNNSTDTGTTVTTSLNSGEFGFKFLANGGSQVTVTNFTNLSNFDRRPAPIFFSATEDNGSLLVLWLDDSGAGPDTDFNDMGVRITASAVPIPAALPLFMSALAGLGFAGYRRRKA
ncbi:hypothetical protein [Thiorhodovibrio frisius]|uniref:PEP-CTERM exosortase interaction domain-containing protein n=1 Tax=Thiorhodovibrio frisius TaxID=631362 RepID=H8YYC2_9GAMM|nr:hypothetical protein [Thiorhodovibrio frisius]EIC23448.1 hypothetical protein Thi970DRAFT_01114 [Thiorhodovibrio frisius]WPL23469.1 hypothetical protein Thiofri_03656 [Thiorhodovibrio frisius]